MLLLAGCGAEDDPSDVTEADTETPDDAVSNACPPAGCEVTIVDVEPEGDELRITWEANFQPDVSRNHIHVYWDTYTADQVSDDAEARGVEQGEWHPTDAYPEFVTESVVAVSERGDSTTICVTASDRDHIVLDSSIVDCHDVSDVLES